MLQYVSLCHKIDPRIKIQSSCVSFSLEYLLSLFPTVGPILILYCMVPEHTIISILLVYMYYLVGGEKQGTKNFA